MDDISRFVSGGCNFLISNPSLSDSTNQRTPNALSTSNSSSSRLSSGVALLSAGIEARTFLLFDMNFVINVETLLDGLCGLMTG